MCDSCLGDSIPTMANFAEQVPAVVDHVKEIVLVIMSWGKRLIVILRYS